ncbi:MAG: CooT family nickel-binding protein [Archaeoglobaceae archaeon]
MCESRVFVNGEAFMEDVVKIAVEGELLILRDVLGHSKKIRGKIVEVDLIGHKITVEGLK